MQSVSLIISNIDWLITIDPARWGRRDGAITVNGEAGLEGEDVRLSTTLAATKLIKYGVTCFIDRGNYHPEASVEGIMATGIAAIVSRLPFDVTKSVLGALERAEAVLEKCAKAAGL